MRKQIVELRERLRQVEERERKTEEESDLKLFLEANVMRLFFQMQSEEVVFSQLKTQEKSIDSMNCSMKKKHEEQMRELDAKKEEVALLSKSIGEKSCDLEMRVKDFNLKETAETERKRNELVLFNDTIRDKSSELEKKEEKFQLKQQAEARNLDLKNKSLELKQKEIEERSIQANTCKRCRLESEHSLSEEKGKYAESLLRPRKKHKPIREHNRNDEDKKKDCAIGVSPSTSSHVQISEAREGETEEAVSIYGIDKNFEPLICVNSEFNNFNKTKGSFMAGQVWALHDCIDSMPRIYGRIKKVSKSGSSWLEPKDKDPVHVSCGRFEWGITVTIKSHLVFSHVMHPIIYGRKSITMIPRKGESWALFSDWSKSWNNNPEQHKPPYRYDFVEVVVDFNDCLGIGVAYLGKVEGFVSVYKQADKHGVVSLMITPEEMPRFSHRVPSFKMNGGERGSSCWFF